MTRFAALVAYDGAGYHGFQRQRAGQPTIQGEIERALTVLSPEPVVITGAGRTDSGVHALGQVISFTLDWQHDTASLQRAANANLAPDIAILQLKRVTPSFHPRFDARSRAYEYRIYNAPVRHPVHRLYSWHVPGRLNLALMTEAAQMLPGRQNFATFGTPPQGNNCVREVLAARWERRGQFLVFHIRANAFLFRMVRSIVGSLKRVGEGAWSVEQFAAVLQAQDRAQSGPAAPPQGLFLTSVEYDESIFDNDYSGVTGI